MFVPFFILLLGTSAIAAPTESVVSEDGIFEGDMILSADQTKMITDSLISTKEDQEKADQEAEQEKKDLSSGDGDGGKSFASGSHIKWPGNTLYFDLSEISWWRFITKSKIRGALEDLQEAVGGCVKFKERESGPRVEVQMKDSGCHSQVGYMAPHTPNKVQVLNLGGGCRSRGIIQHEFMHALGFYHMQSRSDRDNYVTIHENNIKGGQRMNFHKFSPSAIKHFGLPFDYASIMMYKGTAMSRPRGAMTIEAKDKSKQKVMGQRRGPSAQDVKMIRIAYGCE